MIFQVFIKITVSMYTKHLHFFAVLHISINNQESMQILLLGDKLTFVSR